MSRSLALGAILGPLVFTIGWLVLGMLSPGYRMWDIVVPSYSWVAQPISGLGLGVAGPYMNAAFVVSGLLLLAGVGGIAGALSGVDTRARRTAFALLALTPAGMLIDGVFTRESFMPHFGGYLLAIAGGVLGFAFIGRLLRRVPAHRVLGTALMAASALTLVLAVVAQLTFDPLQAGQNIGIAGLTERVLIVEVLTPFVVLGWPAARSTAPGRDA